MNRRTLALEGKEEKQFHGVHCLGPDVTCKLERFK